MTCPCKAELASILRDTGGPIGIAAWAKSVADRLSPAPAEQQELLTGWMAKCNICHGSDGWYITTVISDHCWMLCQDGAWRWAPAEGEDDKTEMFPTESAARAALLAASEPGKVEAGQPRLTEAEFATLTRASELAVLTHNYEQAAQLRDIRHRLCGGDGFKYPPPAPPAEKGGRDERHRDAKG